MSNICVDSCFLIGLYDKTDRTHDKAKKYFKDYFENTPNSILIPWPILYETVKSSLVKNKAYLSELMSDWTKLESRKRLVLCDDSNYRLVAFKECRDELRRESAQYRNLSLADRVIRNMLRERSFNISALITFNARDFCDVCTMIHCLLLD